MRECHPSKPGSLRDHPGVITLDARKVSPAQDLHGRPAGRLKLRLALPRRLPRSVGCALLGVVSGASEKARRVKILNANWVAGQDGEDGRFELMLVTSDDEQHMLDPSPAAMSALVSLAQADTVLVWDPANRTLIAANLRGTMPWTEDAEA